MREAMIILPNADNDGQSLEAQQDQLIALLVDAFGGCTIRDAFGAWRGPKGVMEENVCEFITAHEPSEDNARKLRNIARHIGSVAGQLAVYVRFASGNVEIIDIKQEQLLEMFHQSVAA